MAKNKQTVIKPVPGASWIPAGDLLERVNAVHGGMRNNPAYQDPLVSISLHQPEECRMFRDTTTSESNMNEETDKPIPPLNAKTADGKPYKRFADVEGEIRDVWRRPPPCTRYGPRSRSKPKKNVKR